MLRSNVPSRRPSRSTINIAMSQSLKILLVDDDAADRTAIARALRHTSEQPAAGDCSTTVVEADAVKRGLELLVSEQPDCVLVNCQLSDGTGVEMLRRARAARNRTPFIILIAPGNEAAAV